jgi:hypothetical protein
MDLLKGNFTFMRFHVEDKLPAAFLNFVNSRIKAKAFYEASKSAEEKMQYSPIFSRTGNTRDTGMAA